MRQLGPVRQQGASALPDIGASVWEIVSIVGLLVMFQLVDPDRDPGNYATINLVAPVWLGATLGLASLLIAMRVPDGMWMPMFWFRVATAVYCCGGSLVPFFANDETKVYLEATFAFRPDHMYKFNEIVVWSTFTVLSASAVANRFLGPLRSGSKSAATNAGSAILPIALWFLGVGSVLKYLLVFPTQMGWVTMTLPGVVVQAADSNLIAFFLLTIWAFSAGRQYIALVVGLIVFDMAIGLLLFNKTAVFYPMIMFWLGVFRSGVTVPRLAVALAGFVLSFAVLQPLAIYGRVVHFLQFGSVYGGSLGERWQILQSYYEPTAAVVSDSRVQTALARLSLVNIATFVLNEYDSGRPSDGISQAWVLLVPRLLWPEKPIFNPGGDLALMISGEEGNSVSAGLFAEAYWNLGWAGLPILLIPYAIILTLLSRLTLSVMQTASWLYMPVVFMGMRMGLRVDGQYINDVIGAAAIAFGIFLFCKWLAVALHLDVGRS